MALRPVLNTQRLPQRLNPEDGLEELSEELLTGEEGDDVAGTEGEDLVELENEDGSVTLVPKQPEVNDNDPQDFYKNLLEGDVDLNKVSQFCWSLCDKIDIDKEARSKRDEQYEEGLKRTGLGKEAPGGATFEGASRTVHPILAEGAIDYASRVFGEICPPGGPVKPAPYIDDETDERDRQAMQGQAQRKAKFVNWQLLEDCQEFVPELERVLVQEPMAGDCFMLFWWEDRLRCEFVPVDRVYLPYEASSWNTAPRRTIKLTMPEEEFQRRCDEGYYLNPETSPGFMQDESRAQAAQNKIEGKEDPGPAESDIRSLLRVELNYAFEDDRAPYILILDEESRKPVRLERNWVEDDRRKQPIEWVAHFPFIPWAGAYSIGFPQLIGGLSGALTGAVRALLDTAHIQNSATLVKRKTAKTPGQSQRINIGTINELDTGLGSDDIRKDIMAMPFNPPSETLYRLFLDLDKLARGVVRTALDEAAEQGTNVPVGTQLSRVEQALIVFKTIHARQHRAMGQVIRIVHRLNGLFLDEESQVRELGGLMVRRRDFDGPVDIGPVSDPEVFSEVQRLGQVQAVVARADLPTSAGLYNRLKVEKWLLQQLKIADADELLVQDPDPEELDPIHENVEVSLGKPIKAYVHQDHETHLAVHVAYMASLLTTPIMAMPALGQMIGHLKEHLAYYYQHLMGKAIAAVAMYARQNQLSEPDERQVLMHASQATMQRFQAEMQQLMPLVNQALQLIQQLTPKDPANQANEAQMMQAQATLALAQAEIQSKQQEQALKAKELDQKAQQQMLDHQLKIGDQKLEAIKQAMEGIAAEQANLISKLGIELSQKNAQAEQAIAAVKVAVDAYAKGRELDGQDAARRDAEVKGFNESVLRQIGELSKQTEELKKPKTPRKISVRRGQDGRLQGLDVDGGPSFQVNRDDDGMLLGMEPAGNA